MPADGEYNTVTTLFTEGKAASTIGGPWLVPGIKEAGIDLGIAPMPVLPNGTSLTPFSGVQGVHVLKHAAETKKGGVGRSVEGTWIQGDRCGTGKCRKLCTCQQ